MAMARRGLATTTPPGSRGPAHKVRGPAAHDLGRERGPDHNGPLLRVRRCRAEVGICEGGHHERHQAPQHRLDHLPLPASCVRRTDALAEQQVAQRSSPNCGCVHSLEQANLAQVEELNQRGGRTLSMVDLICARTISAEMAAYVGHRISQGASLLTAANPGGAGKTALLAAAFGFLPTGMPVATVDGPHVIAGAEKEDVPHCYLAHEIGSGHWYGYLWGPAVARYLALASGSHTVASCLHADTIKEMQAQLASRPLRVEPSALLAVDLILFVHVDRGGGSGPGGYRRRVAAAYESDRTAGSHRLIYRWERERDAFERTADVAVTAEVEALAAHLARLADAGPLTFAGLRQAYLASLGGVGWHARTTRRGLDERSEVGAEDP
jgi:hypothetical protein